MPLGEGALGRQGKGSAQRARLGPRPQGLHVDRNGQADEEALTDCFGDQAEQAVADNDHDEDCVPIADNDDDEEAVADNDDDEDWVAVADYDDDSVAVAIADCSNGTLLVIEEGSSLRPMGNRWPGALSCLPWTTVTRIEGPGL
ncbi:hypothetical protein [Streptomyces monashensis]|uniref:hypothetical protein n=1 Tax=Streptomyces monashensis TaxID=1678012 RepID=UPI001160E11A|nr:hypothetical protein [Streptomyces monashensis]